MAENKDYTCKLAKQDIDFFFSRPVPNNSKDKALNRALEHMTQGTTPEKHNVSCQNCWDYYQKMKQKHCGG